MTQFSDATIRALATLSAWQVYLAVVLLLVTYGYGSEAPLWDLQPVFLVLFC
jgi:hypothetical protein